MLRVYLDNCVFNRPFDDQSQTRIRTETEAIRKPREKVESGDIELAWSYLNEFESSRNPFVDIRKSSLEWKSLSIIHIVPSLSILAKSYNLRELGLRQVDSLHVASAIDAKLDYFISTDDGILSKLDIYGSLIIQDPVTFVSGLGAT